MTYPNVEVKTMSNTKQTPLSPMLKRLQRMTPGRMTSQTASSQSSPRKPKFTKQNVRKLIEKWEDLFPSNLIPAVDQKPSLKTSVDSQPEGFYKYENLEKTASRVPNAYWMQSLHQSRKMTSQPMVDPEPENQAF